MKFGEIPLQQTLKFRHPTPFPVFCRQWILGIRLENALRRRQPVLNNLRMRSLELTDDLRIDIGVIVGKKIEPIETYKMNDANYVILSLNSTAGTVKHTVDVLRAKGKRVGALKLRLFRPFPVEELSKALVGKKVLAVFDRAASFGHVAPLYQEVRSALYDLKNKPKVVSYIYGLGGRDLTQKLVEKAFAQIESGKLKNENYLGVRDKDEY